MGSDNGNPNEVKPWWHHSRWSEDAKLSVDGPRWGDIRAKQPDGNVVFKTDHQYQSYYWLNRNGAWELVANPAVHAARASGKSRLQTAMAAYDLKEKPMSMNTFEVTINDNYTYILRSRKSAVTLKAFLKAVGVKPGKLVHDDCHRRYSLRRRAILVQGVCYKFHTKDYFNSAE